MVLLILVQKTFERLKLTTEVINDTLGLVQ